MPKKSTTQKMFGPIKKMKMPKDTTMVKAKKPKAIKHGKLLKSSKLITTGI